MTETKQASRTSNGRVKPIYIALACFVQALQAGADETRVDFEVHVYDKKNKTTEQNTTDFPAVDDYYDRRGAFWLKYAMTDRAP